MTGVPEDSADRREGRGRLSSIDQLPEEAEPDIVWANEQLRKEKLPQTAKHGTIINTTTVTTGGFLHVLWARAE